MIPLPNQVSPLVDNFRKIIRPWVQYLQQFTQAPPNIMSIIVGASPYSYEAKEPGYVHVNGGTVSNIVLTRGSVSLSFVGVKAIPVAINDIVTVTYSVLPTIKFVPSYGQNTTS